MVYNKEETLFEIHSYLMGFSGDTINHIYDIVIEKSSGSFENINPSIIYDSVQEYIKRYFASKEKLIENIADYDLRKLAEHQFNAEKRSFYKV